MGVYFNVSGWKKSNIKANGFMLWELLLGVFLSLVLLVSVLPVFTEAVRQEQRQTMSEELYRQGVVIDESLYHTLRYCRIESVSPTRIVFYTPDKSRAGFTVKNKTVYRMLSNQNDQPLTSTSYHPFVRGRVVVQPYEDRPYFSYDGTTVRIAILLVDERTLQTWPCVLSVVPWRPAEDRDEI